MARNEIVVDAPLARVFAVLKDPSAYGEWVVGSKEVRDADPSFPAPAVASTTRWGWVR